MPDIKEYIMYDSTNIKFKIRNKKNYSVEGENTSTFED